MELVLIHKYCKLTRHLSYLKLNATIIKLYYIKGNDKSIRIFSLPITTIFVSFLKALVKTFKT